MSTHAISNRIPVIRQALSQRSDSQAFVAVDTNNTETHPRPVSALPAEYAKTLKDLPAEWIHVAQQGLDTLGKWCAEEGVAIDENEKKELELRLIDGVRRLYYQQHPAVGVTQAQAFVKQLIRLHEQLKTNPHWTYFLRQAAENPSHIQEIADFAKHAIWIQSIDQITWILHKNTNVDPTKPYALDYLDALSTYVGEEGAGLALTDRIVTAILNGAAAPRDTAHALRSIALWPNFRPATASAPAPSIPGDYLLGVMHSENPALFVQILQKEHHAGIASGFEMGMRALYQTATGAKFPPPLPEPDRAAIRQKEILDAIQSDPTLKQLDKSLQTRIAFNYIYHDPAHRQGFLEGVLQLAQAAVQNPSLLDAHTFLALHLAPGHSVAIVSALKKAISHQLPITALLYLMTLRPHAAESIVELAYGLMRRGYTPTDIGFLIQSDVGALLDTAEGLAELQGDLLPSMKGIRNPRQISQWEAINMGYTPHKAQQYRDKRLATYKNTLTQSAAHYQNCIHNVSTQPQTRATIHTLMVARIMLAKDYAVALAADPENAAWKASLESIFNVSTNALPGARLFEALFSYVEQLDAFTDSSSSKKPERAEFERLKAARKALNLVYMRAAIASTSQNAGVRAAIQSLWTIFHDEMQESAQSAALLFALQSANIGPVTVHTDWERRILTPQQEAAHLAKEILRDYYAITDVDPDTIQVHFTIEPPPLTVRGARVPDAQRKSEIYVLSLPEAIIRNFYWNKLKGSGRVKYYPERVGDPYKDNFYLEYIDPKTGEKKRVDPNLMATKTYESNFQGRYDRALDQFWSDHQTVFASDMEAEFHTHVDMQTLQGTFSEKTANFLKITFGAAEPSTARMFDLFGVSAANMLVFSPPHLAPAVILYSQKEEPPFRLFQSETEMGIWAMLQLTVETVSDTEKINASKWALRHYFPKQKSLKFSIFDGFSKESAPAIKHYLNVGLRPEEHHLGGAIHNFFAQNPILSATPEAQAQAQAGSTMLNPMAIRTVRFTRGRVRINESNVGESPAIQPSHNTAPMTKARMVDVMVMHIQQTMREDGKTLIMDNAEIRREIALSVLGAFSMVPFASYARLVVGIEKSVNGNTAADRAAGRDEAVGDLTSILIETAASFGLKHVGKPLAWMARAGTVMRRTITNALNPVKTSAIQALRRPIFPLLTRLNPTRTEFLSRTAGSEVSSVSLTGLPEVNGVYTVANKQYIRAYGNVYEVLEEAGPRPTWRIARSNGQLRRGPAVRLNAKQEWEINSEVGLKGGGPGMSRMCGDVSEDALDLEVKRQISEGIDVGLRRNPVASVAPEEGVRSSRSANIDRLLDRSGYEDVVPSTPSVISDAALRQSGLKFDASLPNQYLYRLDGRAPAEVLNAQGLRAFDGSHIPSAYFSGLSPLEGKGFSAVQPKNPISNFDVFRTETLQRTGTRLSEDSNTFYRFRADNVRTVSITDNLGTPGFRATNPPDTSPWFFEQERIVLDPVSVQAIEYYSAPQKRWIPLRNAEGKGFFDPDVNSSSSTASSNANLSIA